MARWRTYGQYLYVIGRACTCYRLVVKVSIKRMSAVWESSQHKGSDLLLLLAIADNAHDDGYAWPGIEYLGRKTRISKSTVLRSLKRLEESGELVIDHNRRRGNRYIVTVGLDQQALLATLGDNLKMDSEAISIILTLIQKCQSDTSMYQLDTSVVSPVIQEPSITIKESSVSPSANNLPPEGDLPSSEDISDELDALGLGKAFPDAKPVEPDRYKAKPWSAWGDDKVHPRDGVSAEALRRVGYALEYELRLRPNDGEMEGWLKGLSEFYLAAEGDWSWMKRAITLWHEQEPQYRPTHPRGFVKLARKIGPDRETEFRLVTMHDP